MDKKYVEFQPNIDNIFRESEKKCLSWYSKNFENYLISSFNVRICLKGYYFSRDID